MKRFITSLITINRKDVIISGGAKGADTLAEQFADEHGLKKIIFPADWNKHGKGAGFIRNHDIINTADMLFAFKSKEDSRGTSHSIQLADEKGIPCHIFKDY